MVVERERRDGVGIIRLNRPEARNAVSDEVSAAVEAALDEFETDDEIRAVIVTGTGDVFSAGADLKMVAKGEGFKIATKRGGFGGITTRVYSKPLIAAVNGPALAGGFEIVLACDLVVAADDARFGLPEVKRGLFAAAGGPYRLVRRIPLATATEIVLTGDPIDARRAHDLGLVNRLVPKEKVMDEALALAATIAANGPVAVRKSLRLLHETGDLTEEQARQLSNEVALEVFGSKDAIEGATAFAEKRPPRWTGP
ncbi:MAG TPA: crotonase/enoyl-CoA hydratase family protein [Acidimicrobiia bacterium]|nr:crotonase/enoyl-CoA hydratase family protein [Acidimicrobiia bacterium]